jgi:hypothetical protein
MYAFIVDSQIVAAFVELGPELVGASVDEQRAAGYYAIVGPTRPTDDPATGVAWEPSITLVAGEPTVVWSQRPVLTPSVAAEIYHAAVAAAVDAAELTADLAAIRDFLDDPDVQRVLDQPNNTPLATNDLNRALKALVRQARRNANLSARIARVVVGTYHPEVLGYEL